MDQETIRNLILDGYLNAVYIARDTSRMSAFHPEFEMIHRTEEGIRRMNLKEWQDHIEQGKVRNPVVTAKITFDVEVLDEAEDSAAAKVRIFRDDKQVFTDYLSLYKFADGWKVVAKVYHRYA